jgi:hypothetical protein
VDPAIAASGPSAAQQALLDQGWGFLHTTFLDQNGAAVDPLTLWATLRPLSEGEQPRNLRSLADIFVHFDAIQGPRPSAISFTMLHREGVSEWRISITDPEHRKLFARTLPQLPTKKLDSSLVAYARAGINWNPSGAPEVTGETVIPGICLANGFSTRFAPGQTDQSTGLVLPGVPDLVYLSFMGGAPQGKNYVVNLVMGLEGLSRRGPRGESGGIRFEVLYFENGVQKEPPIPTVVVEIDR